MKRNQIYRFLIQKQNYTCGLCGESLKSEWEFYEKWRNEWSNGKETQKTIKRYEVNIDLDHKIPKSKLRGIWWKNDLINLQVTHKTCNNKKGNN